MNLLKSIVIVLGLLSSATFSTHAYFNDSAKVAGNTFTAGTWVVPQVETPAFSPPEGTYSSAQTVTISSATIGATIYYTVDESAPTTSSLLYSTAIDIAVTTTLKAIAVKTGMMPSNVATAVYTINPPSPPAPARVVINEVYYDVGPGHGTFTGEWIELYNAGGTAINLKNWEIGDNFSFIIITIENTILGPKKYAILTPHAPELTSKWTIPPDALVIDLGTNKIGNGLGNSGDKLILKDENDNIVDAISYGTDTTVLDPSIPDVSAGQSIEREPDGVDTGTAADFVANPTPTPGS